MDKIGLNWNLLSVQILHFTILAGWPVLAFVALIALRRSSLAGLTLLGWTLLVVAVPVLGALAFLIVRPGTRPMDLAPHQEVVEPADASGG